jgi:acetyl-CoA carboxylase biotin carboxylase subunit
MRIARNEAELRTSINQARQEAQAAFNDSGLYLEKYLERPRHIEVQILADQQGHVIHLYERDCSTQRRYQKLVEESPSPGLESRRRDDLCKSAVRLAKAAGYTNAGTFEFLVDGKKSHYFIEANARIQVEHPVTELTTGIDLVKAQIRIAAGEPLGMTQREIRPRGAALECRINAENPDDGFRPSAGRIEKFRPPGGFGVRVDSHAHDGYRISPRYDSLIGKLIVHQPTREQAIACMRRCLSEFVITPTKTTIPLHQRILELEAFTSGTLDTGFVERTLNNQDDSADR